MFNLTKTFVNEKMSITPIFEGKTLLFSPKELGEQLGYSDLVDSIDHSLNAKRDIDYVVYEGKKLEKLRKMFECNLSGSGTPLQISSMARSATMLTESGFWWVVMNSNKPECVNFRQWVTSKVLPEIRKTGKYGVKKEPTLEMINKSWDAAIGICSKLGMNKSMALEQGALIVEQKLGQNPYDLVNKNNSLCSSVVLCSKPTTQADKKIARIIAWAKRHKIGTCTRQQLLQSHIAPIKELLVLLQQMVTQNCIQILEVREDKPYTIKFCM